MHHEITSVIRKRNYKVLGLIASAILLEKF